MTIDLVDGKLGELHIDGDDLGTFNMGAVGPESYVLNVKNKLAFSMSTANSGVLQTGMALMMGRRVHVTAPETISI